MVADLHGAKRRNRHLAYGADVLGRLAPDDDPRVHDLLFKSEYGELPPARAPVPSRWTLRRGLMRRGSQAGTAHEPDKARRTGWQWIAAELPVRIDAVIAAFSIPASWRHTYRNCNELDISRIARFLDFLLRLLRALLHYFRFDLGNPGSYPA